MLGMLELHIVQSGMINIVLGIERLGLQRNNPKFVGTCRSLGSLTSCFDKIFALLSCELSNFGKVLRTCTFRNARIVAQKDLIVLSGNHWRQQAKLPNHFLRNSV
jgi:hypothetical protein